MTNPSDDLHRLVEAVKVAGADIAPSYREYVQLAFAIASDCGEAGRADFHTLCSFSSKYDARHADKLFTNALRTGYNNVHLGTAFHLADRGGVQQVEKRKQKNFPACPARARREPAKKNCATTPTPMFRCPSSRKTTSGLRFSNASSLTVTIPGNTTRFCWDLSRCWAVPCHNQYAVSTAANGNSPVCKLSSPPHPLQVSGSCRGCAS